MTYSNGENPRVQFDPRACDAFLEHLRAELQKPSVCAVTVDLEGVERITPAILQSLRAAGDEAQLAGKALYVDHAGPVVYKALHLAKLGPLVKRLQHAATID
ncbi:MAG TPA: STAS domain-containing protein [Candidatus Margulisiibacteriota bacterium]|nr:STAS domain-containing protein [Candidatus Margulisiibacteriota bacterium]